MTYAIRWDTFPPVIFSRLFKKYTGQTPGEYRENIHAERRPAAEKEAEQL
jgi:two-component system response regulator YesN